MSIPWQEEIRQRLGDRNARESAYSGIIEQYRRLAQQTRLLKERNQSLLRAVGSVRNGPPAGSQGSSSGEDQAVRNAYIQSLESEISSLRDERADLYKTQTQSTQRLLAMTETLREKEELSRIGADDLRRVKEDALVLRRKVEQHNELMTEKDERIQTLTDEIQTLELELNQVSKKNQELKEDNASLLSRWLDKMQELVDSTNDANMNYETAMAIKGQKAPSEGSELWSSPGGETSFIAVGSIQASPDPTDGHQEESTSSESEWLIVDESE